MTSSDVREAQPERFRAVFLRPRSLTPAPSPPTAFDLELVCLPLARISRRAASELRRRCVRSGFSLGFGNAAANGRGAERCGGASQCAKFNETYKNGT